MDEDRLKRLVGGRIRAWRQRAGLTQEQLASAVGRTTEGISNLERGLSLPTLPTLMGIAEVLHAPVSELLEVDAADGSSLRRAQMETSLKLIVRGLSEDALAIALAQIEILAKGLAGK